MANENSKAVETLSKLIISTCQKLIKKADYPRMYNGTIVDINVDGYTVAYLNQCINIKCRAIGILSVGDIVKICFPNGNRKKAFIIIDLDTYCKLNNK